MFYIEVNLSFAGSWCSGRVCILCILWLMDGLCAWRWVLVTDRSNGVS